jgi:polyisoprenoid-binding protein YceI
VVGVPDGSYRVGPQCGRLLVRTARTGLGAKAGHDLVIEVTRWRGNVIVHAASPASSSVTVEADVDSLEVREGTGGVKPLTGADRAGIRDTLRGILSSATHPVITFVSSQVSGTAQSFPPRW